MSFRHVLNIMVALIIALWVATWLPVTDVRIWMDSTTGSMKVQQSHLFFTSRPTVQHSEIERWIARHEGTHRPDWKFLNVERRNVFGKIVAGGCSTAPEIYPLHVGAENTRFVHAASDAEVSEFVRVMKTGTPAAKEQAIAGAIKTISGQR